MNENLELKAKYPNIKRAESIAEELAGKPVEILEQKDTYLKVSDGRLKIRETTHGSEARTELIWYDREERGEERYCRYERSGISNSEGLISILLNSLGVDVIVKKTRRVYVWNGCRIHLDVADRLGPFIEFEVPKNKDNTEKDLIRELIDKFGITDLDVINCSYADLIRTVEVDY